MRDSLSSPGWSWELVSWPVLGEGTSESFRSAWQNQGRSRET